MAAQATQVPRDRREVGPPDPSREGGTTRPLDLYFQDLAQNRRLAAGDELALALELRAARQTLWQSFLDAPLGTVLEFAFAHIEPERRPNTQARRYARLLAQDAAPSDSATTATATAAEALSVALVEADRDGFAARALISHLRDAQSTDAGVLRRCLAADARVRAVRSRFVAANLGLVVVLAKRYEQRHLTLCDLIQEGNTGLLKAVDRFDPDRGFRFSTYAVWWIRHSLGRALSDKSREIRLPVHVAERQQTVLRCRSRFEGRHGRLPTTTELAELAKLPEAKVTDLLAVEYTRAGSNRRDTGERAPLDVDDLPSGEAFDPADLDTPRFTSLLQRTMRTLPGIEQDVLSKRYGLDGEEPRTLREVGEVHALSRERIRQLQVRALGNLRRAFGHLAS